MKFLGVNVGRIGHRGAGAAHPLADGAAALLADGAVACAVIEERLARQRYAGGFRESARTCLRATDTALAQIDGFALSSCCGPHWSREDASLHLHDEFSAAALCRPGKTIDPERVVVVDHHLSHAMLAFATMPASTEPALVCVIDGMGNRAGPPPVGEHAWWQGGFDRQSYFLARWVDGRARLELVHREAQGADEVGIGEIYRAVTHFLGWHSYQHAGKTMALAGFGDADALAGATFVSHGVERGIHVPIPNWHDRPVDQVLRVLQGAGHGAVRAHPADSVLPDTPGAADLAARLQRQVEGAIAGFVPMLAQRFGVRRVAFSGGVALNCVALGALHLKAPGLELSVPCAPSDTGQALGNALWAAYAEESPFAEPARPAAMFDRCDFGPRYAPADVAAAVAAFRARHGEAFRALQVDTPSALATMTGQALVDQQVVGIRQGGSEYGPRALGHASIVADPRQAGMHARVNGHKRREAFRPYAPSILAEHAPQWLAGWQHSPFMSFASSWTAEAAKQVPAVVHVDGTARFQTVSAGSGFYRQVLEDFMRRTGVPVLLNTSFNGHGEPIVESPADALHSFAAMQLDALVLDHWFIHRNR